MIIKLEQWMDSNWSMLRGGLNTGRSMTHACHGQIERKNSRVTKVPANGKPDCKHINDFLITFKLHTLVKKSHYIKKIRQMCFRTCISLKSKWYYYLVIFMRALWFQTLRLEQRLDMCLMYSTIKKSKNINFQKKTLYFDNDQCNKHLPIHFLNF